MRQAFRWPKLNLLPSHEVERLIDVPPDSMGIIKRVLADVISPNRGAFLSFGILGALWAASGGFAAAIDALNKVIETRPFWKTRPLSIGLTFVIGGLLLLALAVMVVGPRFGEWLAGKAHVSQLFAMVWPYLHSSAQFVFIAGIGISITCG
jgi:membrane protein